MDLAVTGQAIELPRNDLAFPVHSPWRLSHNPEFNDLKQRLEEYQPDQSKWTDLVHTSLSTLLTEVVYTQDTTIQQSLLNKVSRWYYQKIRSREPPVVRPASPPKTPKRPSKRPKPPPAQASQVQPPKFRAFCEPEPDLEASVVRSLNQKFEQMRQHEKNKLDALKYRDRALADWSQQKHQRATLLSYKLHLRRQRRQAREQQSLPLSLENAKLFDFSFAEEASEPSVDSDTEEFKYSHFSPVGARRRLMTAWQPKTSGRPAKRLNGPATLSAFGEVVPQPPKKYPSPVSSRHVQLREAVDSRAKLAKIPQLSSYRALEQALVIPEETQLPRGLFPKGGEFLPSLKLKSAA